MGYLTESKLATTVDIPISLPLTELKQGDWLILSTVKLTTPMRITYRHINISIVSASVDEAEISNSNRIFGNMGLVYVALRKDYTSGSPGAAGALDVFGITALGTFARPDSSAMIQIDTPGVYSWLVANNMQPSTTSSVPASTSIDFRVAITGMARLDLE